jgi:hypothetical protein
MDLQRRPGEADRGRSAIGEGGVRVARGQERPPFQSLDVGAGETIAVRRIKL